MPDLHSRLAKSQTASAAAASKRAPPIWPRLTRWQPMPIPTAARVSCSNMAHVAAAAGEDQSDILSQSGPLKPNIAIVTAYNDMLSAHQPYEGYPQPIKAAARQAGATAQVAGGVPAMCDGVTQGRPGMELSLFSRDIIAMSTGVGLSHNVYDAALCLGVCDKIVPGLVIGALSFGHLPVIFVPAGPMSSGLPNAEKAISARPLPAERWAVKSCCGRKARPITGREPVPLRHRQFKPDADGGDGPASARRGFCASAY